MKKSVLVIKQPPNLFGKHGVIEFLKILETQTTQVLWTTQGAPFRPMNFSLVPPLPPPEFSDQRLYFITKSNGDFEATHSKGWDCLYDCLEKNFTPRLR